MRHTVDFLRLKGVPMIGLIPMMDGCLCPNCRETSHQLLSPKLALEAPYWLQSGYRACEEAIAPAWKAYSEAKNKAPPQDCLRRQS